MKKFIWFLVGAVSMVSVTALAATFTDSGSFADWYADPVADLSEMGIIEGYPDGSFQAGNTVNRAELAVMLDRLHDQILTEVAETGGDSSSDASGTDTVGDPGGYPTAASMSGGDALGVDQFIILLNEYDELSFYTEEEMLPLAKVSIVMAMGGFNRLQMEPDVFDGTYLEYEYSPEVGPKYTVYYAETGHEAYVSLEYSNDLDENYFDWYGPYNVGYQL